MLKIYVKPTVEYIKFYSDEEMTLDSSADLGGTSGTIEEGTPGDGWID